MKKVIIILALTFSCASFCQEKSGENENAEKKSPAERVEKQLKKMSKDLNLDQKQVATLRELLSNQAKKREEKLIAFQTKKAEGTTLSKEEKKALVSDVKQNQEEMKGKMKEVLNPEQYLKWEQDQEEKREKMIEKIKERRSQK